MSAQHFANSARGETTLMIDGSPHIIRPTFTALVATEDELGSLYALVERASEGKLRLSEITSLFWHCLSDRGNLSQEQVGEAIMAMGLAAVAAPLRSVLHQILQGRA